MAYRTFFILKQQNTCSDYYINLDISVHSLATKKLFFTRYTATIKAENGSAGSEILGDFVVVNDKDLKADEAKEGAPTEVRVEVKYTPSQLKELRAVLVLQSPDGGEYKSVLAGYAQPPQPQGPFNGKSMNVEFRNPFRDACDFTISIDNPADFALKVPNKQKLDGGKTLAIGVDFKGAKPSGSRLIVSCDDASRKVTTPWIYFLKGQ